MDFTNGLTGFDWVVVAIVALMAVAGLVRGFTQELLSLAGWLAAALAVRFFHEGVTGWLEPKVGGEAAAAVIAFLGIFFGVLILSRILAGMAGGFSRRSVLGPMDRILGMGFGAVKGLILVSALFLLAEFSTGLFDPESQPPEWLTQSRSAPLLKLSADAMVGWVHELREAVPTKEEGFQFPPGMDIQPNQPSMEPYPHEQTNDGYTASDRQALDELLNEGAQAGEQVAI